MTYLIRYENCDTIVEGVQFIRSDTCEVILVSKDIDDARQPAAHQFLLCFLTFQYNCVS